MYTTITLNPNDNRKSFYGKATVGLDDASQTATLYSYGTAVAMYDGVHDTFCRIWGGYSATTMRHVNAFLAYLSIDGGGKKWWDTLDCDVDYNPQTWKPAVSAPVLTLTVNAEAALDAAA